MSKLEALHTIFIVLSVTVMATPVATNGPVCVLVGSTPTTPSPTKPDPTKGPNPEQGECGVQPAWIDQLFAKHHKDSGLKMRCDYIKEAFYAGIFYMRNWKHSIKRQYWCQIEYLDSSWRSFNEYRIDDYLTRYFKGKINKIAETYPMTEYGCTTRYRAGYFSFHFHNFVLCIYSRRPLANGTLAPCPNGT